MNINKMLLSKMMMASCVLALFAGTLSTDANAKYTKRGDKWESSFKILQTQTALFEGDNESSSLGLKSDYGWGFTFGYNVNPHILVNFDFSSTTPSYDAKGTTDTGAPVEIKHKMNLLESQFNVVYNLFAADFTPFIQAGAGWSYVDSNVADGPPNAYCWWTWWGQYVCDGYQPTYNDTSFSYNAAVGVRYELPNSMFFRASYRQSWIDFGNKSNSSLASYNIEIGSIF